MSNNSEITIYNLYEHVMYNYDEENQVLGIYWDCNNEKLNILMNDEMSCYNYRHNIEKKYSSLWIDTLKRYVSYRDGDKIQFQVKSKTGSFHIFIKKDMNSKYIFEEIGDDGYLYVSPYGDSISTGLIKCNCLYNDLLDEESGPYIFK